MNQEQKSPTPADRPADESVEFARELGDYRSFLRSQALHLSARYRGRLEPSDIVQKTLMEAHQNLGQFRGQTDREMAKWLSQMLANNIADAVRALRRMKRDIARERSLKDVAPGSEQGASDWIPSEHTSPSIRASNAEQRRRLTEAIEALPEAQRDVVRLHHLQGRSLAEVAARTDRSQSAVAGLLYRGLKSLRNSLA